MRALRIAAYVLLSGAVLGAAGASAATDVRLPQAASRSDRSAVRALLQQKVDVNAAEPDGTTALHWAARRDDLETAQILLRAHARVDAATRYGVTPLYLAAVNGNAAMIDALLAAGADPNAANPGGETVLMTASRTGRLDAVKRLVDRGANINAQTNVVVPDGTTGKPEQTSGDIGAHGPGFYHSRAVPSPSGGMTPLLYAAQRRRQLLQDLSRPPSGGRPAKAGRYKAWRIE